MPIRASNLSDSDTDSTAPSYNHKPKLLWVVLLVSSFLIGIGSLMCVGQHNTAMRNNVNKMILYKDIFTNLDVCTDEYKSELVDDIYYEVTGKFIIEDSSVDDVLVCNFVAAGKLGQVPSIVDKKDLKKYIKTYSNKLLEKVGEGDPARAAFLKANLNNRFVSPMLDDFEDFNKNLRFFASGGDEFALEGGVIFVTQDAPFGEEVAGTVCTAKFLKDGIFGEKC